MTFPQPLLSIVILNFNGKRWLNRCLESIRAQTIFDNLEVIIADNQSSDGSDQLAKELVRHWPNGTFVQNGANLGYCEGNNRGAQHARGEYLLFLNNDTWLETDCLERLLEEVQWQGAGAGNPQILNYQDCSLQGFGPSGFDLCGFLTGGEKEYSSPTEIFASPGCAYLVRRDIFEMVGRFDPVFFMYADETDLSWRIWIAGYRIITVPRAKLHHWGAGASVGAEGEEKSRFRISEFGRFYTNRNSLMLLLKNCEHFLLFLVVLQCVALLSEAIMAWFITRNLTFVKRAYIDAIVACWQLRSHWKTERGRIRKFRKRSDFWMVRFLSFLPSRIYEIKRMIRYGLPTLR